MDVYLGDRHYNFPSDSLSQLEDHTEFYHAENWEMLRQSMKKNGYLRIRNLHSRDEVLQARLAVLGHINESGADKLDTQHPMEDGILDSRCGRGCIPFMEGVNDITNHPEIKAVLEGARPRRFFEKFLGEEVATFEYKWLRGIHKDAFTGAHVDNVYMARGTCELYTMWTPIGDVTVDMGTLAIVEASHKDNKFKKLQETYGNCDIEKENIVGSGWFTEDPLEVQEKFSCKWKTANFEAGDVLIFTNRTLHMSTKNITNKVRISCDTRWQKKQEPMDPRFQNNKAHSVQFGLWADDDQSSNEKQEQKRTIDDMKVIWGL